MWSEKALRRTRNVLGGIALLSAGSMGYCTYEGMKISDHPTIVEYNNIELERKGLEMALLNCTLENNEGHKYEQCISPLKKEYNQLGEKLETLTPEYKDLRKKNGDYLTFSVLNTFFLFTPSLCSSAVAHFTLKDRLKEQK